MNVFLANPRGFCAGVERAISIVEMALKKYGSPIYIKHEIVHNKYVVDSLKKKGAIFVDSIDDVPLGGYVIYSAHGVSRKVEDSSRARDLKVFDATCPLVKKIHNQIVKLDQEQKQIILIGHSGHPEVEGTSGRINAEVLLVENKEDALNLQVKDPDNLSYTTQTTLSVDDTKEIVDILKSRFPNIIEPKSDNICYATQNRQDSVKKLVKKIDLLLVIGSINSSNSNRLKDIGVNNNIESYLISTKDDIRGSWLKNKKNIAITAGASAPEILVREVIAFLETNYNIQIHNESGVTENIMFNLPKELRDEN
ncbi:MAG: 4-hydroxy-3-methylbut-2-enyl diphosphate reductase [Rickettsiales bacterium]|nr:4-hydroxy-3-methylbut-2-enyl diphosphate reductase [Rickettsiales bacterium]